MGVYLVGVHLMDVHLMDVHLMNVPLSWTSLAGLSRGHVSASAPKPVSSASAQEPVSSNPLEPPSPAPALASAPEPRRSKRTLSIPGHYAVLAGRCAPEASQGWKRVDSYLDSTLGWLSRAKL
jgi:hypothetical protein